MEWILGWAILCNLLLIVLGYLNLVRITNDVMKGVPMKETVMWPVRRIREPRK